MCPKNSKISEAVVHTLKKPFSIKTNVSIIINADSQTVWEALLTHSIFSQLNNGVNSINENIDNGNVIRITSALNSNKLFKLKVKEFVPRRKLILKKRRVKRNFRLKELNAQTVFYMSETIRSPFLVISKIKSFDENFHVFANDLKDLAETK